MSIKYEQLLLLVLFNDNWPFQRSRETMMEIKPVGFTITTEREGKRQQPGSHIVWWDRDTHSIADYFPGANSPRRERVSAAEAVAAHVAFLGDCESKPQAMALYAEADVQQLIKQRDELLQALKRMEQTAHEAIEGAQAADG
ncbi:TPA: hypothetical protein L5U90_003360 [Pseudomonas aeruginosa]|nr:hypothetical protein [Pseudomonas aeruginosa]